MNTIGPLIINIDGVMLSKDEAKLLEHDLIGSVILFSHNYNDIEQLNKLIKDIKNVKDNILISVDHEGGRIQRFQKGFTKLPSFEEIGSLYSDDETPNISEASKLAYACGFVSGHELSKAGVDINFSPVVDINRNLLEMNQYVLKDRCFSDNIETILNLAKSYVSGSLCGGITPVLKHYPGHGAITGDTHTDYCTSDLVYDDLLEDLLPFLTLHAFTSGSIPIMTSHIKFPNVDDKIVTYSKKWLTDIPKSWVSNREVFFISDDLEMKAAVTQEEITAAKRVIDALEAGCNMVIATTLLKNDIVESKKSHEYFNKYYLTQELIDYSKNFCNDIIHNSLDLKKNKKIIADYSSSYEDNLSLIKQYRL